VGELVGPVEVSIDVRSGRPFVAGHVPEYEDS
jgi:hypothetical protein